MYDRLIWLIQRVIMDVADGFDVAQVHIKTGYLQLSKYQTSSAGIAVERPTNFGAFDHPPPMQKATCVRSECNVAQAQYASVWALGSLAWLQYADVSTAWRYSQQQHSMAVQSATHQHCTTAQPSPQCSEYRNSQHHIAILHQSNTCQHSQHHTTSQSLVLCHVCQVCFLGSCCGCGAIMCGSIARDKDKGGASCMSLYICCAVCHGLCMQVYTTSDSILGTKKLPFLRPSGPIYQLLGKRMP